MSYIIVGIDGSDCAQAALEAAVDQAALIEAQVRAVSVVATPVMSGYEFGPVDLEHIRDAAAHTLESALTTLAASRGEEAASAVTTEVLSGHVGIEILRAAQRGEGAAMVVVGSRGYGPIKSVLLGSVTTYLAHHLQCPLLIIPDMSND